MTFFADLYRNTLLIVATENLVMGITLLFIYYSRRHQCSNIRKSVYLLSAAMFLMTICNYAEYFIPTNTNDLSNSLSIMILAASIEIFLILYTYLALLNVAAVTKRKIFFNLLQITIFVLPICIIIPDEHPILFNTWFYGAVSFYFIKFIYLFCVYKRSYHKAQTELLDNFNNERASQLLRLNNIYYVVVIIGSVTMVVPFTDYMVLTIYNIFLFFTYFYLYAEMVRELHHINAEPSISDHINPVLIQYQKEEKTDEPKPARNLSRLMQDREGLYNDWLSKHAYCHPGITIEEVATELGINRTTLSLYLNTELKKSFYEWISDLRVEEAKRLLVENPDTPIFEIACYVGIEDRSNFDKIFKRVTGMSAAMYRKQNSNAISHPGLTAIQKVHHE